MIFLLSATRKRASPLERRTQSTRFVMQIKKSVTKPLNWAICIPPKDSIIKSRLKSALDLYFPGPLYCKMVY